MRTFALLTMATLATATGCVVVHDHRGGVGDAVPTGSPTSAIQGGAGVLVNPGTMAGYGITAAQGGGSFRLVWTGEAAVTGTYSEFYGSVWTPGIFETLTPGCGGACPLEGDDFVSLPITVSGGERFDFDAITTTGLDGVDFTTGNEPVYFDLFIDGIRYPQLVLFTDATTGRAATAPSLPFGLITQ